jgi:hypothetical protein
LHVGDIQIVILDLTLVGTVRTALTRCRVHLERGWRTRRRGVPPATWRRRHPVGDQAPGAASPVSSLSRSPQLLPIGGALPRAARGQHAGAAVQSGGDAPPL